MRRAEVTATGDGGKGEGPGEERGGGGSFLSGWRLTGGWDESSRSGKRVPGGAAQNAWRLKSPTVEGWRELGTEDKPIVH